MSVTADLKIELSGIIRGVNALGTPQMPFAISDVASFVPGVGSGQANLLFSPAADRVIAASANDDLDLSGALTGVFGVLLAFTAVRAIVIKAAAANINNLIIGGAPANGFLGPFGAAAHTIVLRPGEEFVISNRNAGWPVVAGTGDILRIANGGAGSSVSYQIAIIGS